MRRLFVAVRPPDAIRACLGADMGGISGARWENETQLHLTLRFVGEVDGACVRDLDSALAAIRHAPFELRIDGLGCFERRGRPTCLWAGVTPVRDVEALHRKVDLACTQVALAPDPRKYVPHITLARLFRHGGLVTRALARTPALDTPGFRVETFGLWESHLGREGAHHALIALYPLRR